MEKYKKLNYSERMKEKTLINNKLMRAASVASISTAAGLIILKLVTFFLTGSMAILSSLFDSIQDSMTSLVNLIAIRHATEPADKEHRFGHGKAQALGSLIQGVIIAAASLFLLKESCTRLFNPVPITDINLGIIITIIAIVATLILLRFQRYVIGKTNSLSIKADMAHYTGDIMMNVGVIISMGLAYYLDWLFVDSLFGILVAFYLLYVVYGILKESITMLMDTEMPTTIRHEIKKLALSYTEVKSIHSLKTRQSGDDIFIQFCIHLDQNLTLKQAHDITDKIEQKIQKQMPGSHVIIHPEPLLMHEASK